jgi:hypothetical protein
MLANLGPTFVAIAGMLINLGMYESMIVRRCAPASCFICRAYVVLAGPQSSICTTRCMTGAIIKVLAGR